MMHPLHDMSRAAHCGFALPRALSPVQLCLPAPTDFHPTRFILREQGWQMVLTAHLILPQPRPLSWLCGWQMSKPCSEDPEAS